jgi:hypothetical protein
LHFIVTIFFTFCALVVISQTGGVQRSINYEEDIMAMDKGLGTVRNVAEAVTMGGVRSLAKGTEHAKKGADMLVKFGKTLVMKGGRATTPERARSGGLEAGGSTEAPPVQQWANIFSTARVCALNPKNPWRCFLFWAAWKG